MTPVGRLFDLAQTRRRFRACSAAVPYDAASALALPLRCCSVARGDAAGERRRPTKGPVAQSTRSNAASPGAASSSAGCTAATFAGHGGAHPRARPPGAGSKAGMVPLHVWLPLADGGMFAGSYACVGGVSSVVPVDPHIRGCPPEPVHISKGLLALLDHGAIDRRSPMRGSGWPVRVP